MSDRRANSAFQSFWSALSAARTLHHSGINADRGGPNVNDRCEIGTRLLLANFVADSVAARGPLLGYSAESFCCTGGPQNAPVSQERIGKPDGVC